MKIYCPKCGSDNIATERRIDGNHICGVCHWVWKNTRMTSPSIKIKITFPCGACRDYELVKDIAQKVLNGEILIIETADPRYSETFVVRTFSSNRGGLNEKKNKIT